MSQRPGDRIFGVETEFGCLVTSDTEPEAVVEQIKNHVFYDMRLGAIDYYTRDDVFEPALSGGFLTNGARLYIDAVGSHLEYATAECRDLKDLVANDRAGQRQIVHAIKELGLQDDVSIYNNSVDHFGGHTFGCHENYLVQVEEDFFARQVPQLYSFLTTRQIFAGAGRVGGHILAESGPPDASEFARNPIDYIWISEIYSVLEDPTVQFQLSQRADHIIKTMSSRVRFSRAMINPKWESIYSFDGTQRLHLLFGEGNQNEYAYALKVGTTCLVLRLLEDNLLEDSMRLASPLLSLRHISRDPNYQWKVLLDDGSEANAIAIQRELHSLAERYSGSSPDTDWVLTEWDRTLTDLANDPLSMGDRLDWVAKRNIVDMYRKEMDLDWSDDALHSVDLEYHNIDPEKSLFYAYTGSERVVSDLDIIDAMTDPPQNTRAKGRARLVKRALETPNKRRYAFDWNLASLDQGLYISLDNPFDTYDEV